MQRRAAGWGGLELAGRPPGAVWIDRGSGSRVVDVDGTEYVDLHGGFGVGIVGHAHPAIVAAVSDRVRKGTHFAQPTEDAVVVARELARRFGLPMWRYNNSGTESTMDAVHLMRVATGRTKIIKVEGTYHGHHDSVQSRSTRRPRRPGRQTGRTPCRSARPCPPVGAADPRCAVR